MKKKANRLQLIIGSEETPMPSPASRKKKDERNEKKIHTQKKRFCARVIEL